MNKAKLLDSLFPEIDRLYRKYDRQQIRRTKNIRMIPEFEFRRGGKLSYGEWAHVIGIFQTLIYQNCPEAHGNDILDIGCGTGLLGIASDPFVHLGGSYTGIDIQKLDINFCKKHYIPKRENFKFIHFDLFNPMYAKKQSTDKIPWPVENNSKDLITALSVWTHLNEEDSIYYFKEIYRVLKKGAKAIITFFYLDDIYYETLPSRQKKLGRYHSLRQQRFILDQSAYGSKYWFAPEWVKQPEDVIGVNKEGMELMLKESGLKLLEYHPGNWKEIPGLYFQDIMILEK